MNDFHETMDRYRIDGTKINYHPDRVAQWLAHRDEWEGAKDVFPLYIEISPVGACNHRCTFCAVDYIGYPANFWDADVLNQRMGEMADCGVKSVMFAGEGEPLLHKRMGEMVLHAEKVGLDVAFTTNGVLLKERFVDDCLHAISWIKVSLNGGDEASYEKVHRTKGEDFHKVVKNLTYAVEAREKKGGSCTLGAQMVLIPENVDAAESLVALGKDIGLDYVVIKPYSQHHQSITRRYESIDYSPIMELEQKLKSYATDDFQVIFRHQAISRALDGAKHYERCHATPYLWAYLMSDGTLYGCSAFLKNPDFLYGNLNEISFKEAWHSEQRRKNFEQMKNGFDLSRCRHNCRMEAVNLSLEDLINPPEHVNFI